MLSLEKRLRQILVLPKEEAMQQLLILIREREAKAREYVPYQTQNTHRHRVQEKQILNTYA